LTQQDAFLEEKRSLGDMGINWRIILKWILKEQTITMWIHLVQDSAQ
jgi:hypothetical protein